ncbi:MAG: flavodoxin family protein [Candidatus Latescibacterota bacterium]|jgi:multimeric flavodoxin WrbA
MKVVAINGSPRAEGNTRLALDLVGAQLAAAGIESELVQVGHLPLHGCIGCGRCAQNQDQRCALPDDGVNAIVARMKEADGIVLGSPVYFAGIAGTMKCFLDRAFYVAGANGGLFRHKAGAAVVALRRSGAVTTFDQLNHYLHYAEMLVPSSNYWSAVHGAKPGEAVGDGEGVQVMEVLGRNLAWLLGLVKMGRQASILPPPAEPKVRTNFIR